MLTNIVTDNKEIPEDKKTDLVISLITLKYTQSNSVCYVKDGQAIGIGAGQQSRIHCTRLAGNKADIWWLRQHPKVLGLQFIDNIRRPDRDNAIDVYISDEHDDVLAEGVWQNTFKVKPEVLTEAERRNGLQRTQAFALVLTLSSHSATTSRELKERCGLHCRAGRIYQGRSCYHDLQQVQHGNGIHWN